MPSSARWLPRLRPHLAGRGTIRTVQRMSAPCRLRRVRLTGLPRTHRSDRRVRALQVSVPEPYSARVTTTRQPERCLPFHRAVPEPRQRRSRSPLPECRTNLARSSQVGRGSLVEPLCHQHELLVLQPENQGREVGASWQRACEVTDRGGEDLSEHEKAGESSCPFEAGGAHDSQA